MGNFYDGPISRPFVDTARSGDGAALDQAVERLKTGSGIEVTPWEDGHGAAATALRGAPAGQGGGSAVGSLGPSIAEASGERSGALRAPITGRSCTRWSLVDGPHLTVRRRYNTPPPGRIDAPLELSTVRVETRATLEFDLLIPEHGMPPDFGRLLRAVARALREDG